jgi:hypothetical protein
MNKSVR